MDIIQPERPQRVKRSNTDKMLAGVCGGLGTYFNFDSTLIRLIFAFAAVFAGTGILAYIVMWIIIPKESY